MIDRILCKNPTEEELPKKALVYYRPEQRRQEVSVAVKHNDVDVQGLLESAKQSALVLVFRSVGNVTGSSEGMRC